MDKRLTPLIRDLERQGWRCEPSTDGWMCYPPDKTNGPVSIHKTPSDGNWYNACLRLLKKRGFRP
jgi:hypothetical protein